MKKKVKKEKKTREVKVVEEKKEVKENKKDFRPIWIYFLILIVIGILGGVIVGLTGKDLNEIVKISNISVPVIVLFIFIMIYRDRLKDDYKRLTKDNYKMILIYSVITISVNYLLCNLIKVDNPNQDTVVDILMSFKLTGTLVLGFIAPFVEEMIYRYSLRTLIKDKTLYIVVSSVVFGISHGIGYQAIIYIFIGVMLSLVYLRSKENIFASTIVHAFNNVLSILMVFLGL